MAGLAAICRLPLRTIGSGAVGYVERGFGEGAVMAGGGGASPAILMIDAARQVIDCTPAAAAMLARRDPMAEEFGRLAMRRAEDGASLTESIRLAVDVGASVLSVGQGAVRIEAVRMGSDGASARLLLICHDRVPDSSRRVDVAAERFGLTVAERRLLALLFAGKSLATAAVSLGVARTTARTHLQRIFDKTGRRRQSDLVRLVAMGGGPVVTSAFA